MLNYCFLLLCLGFSAHANILDLEYLDEFQIQQEPSMRRFRIVDTTQTFGTIVNSHYGQLDFYDSNEVRLYTNFMDSIYDNDGNCMGWIEWKEDSEANKWFWQRKSPFYTSKTHLVIYSNKIPLFTFDEEGEGGSFVFRECETGKPLAVAIWSWFPSGIYSIPLFDYQIQNWNVIMVDRSAFERIPFAFLAFSLIKHSQLHFPSPSDFLYE